MPPFRIVFDAVGRVGDHQLRHSARKKRLHQARIPAVAAGDAMGSELPDVARLRYRDLGDFRDLILVGEAGLHPRKRSRQFLGRKTQRRKIGADCGKIGQLQAEHFGIPAGIQSDPVVGKDQLTTLCIGQSSKNNDRRFGQPQFASGGQPAVPGNDIRRPRRPGWDLRSQTRECCRRSRRPGPGYGSARCGRMGSIDPAASIRSAIDVP